MNKLVFTPPAGEDEIDPDWNRLERRLLVGPTDYWESGSGDGGLRFFQGEELKAEMILMVREPHGVFVQYVAANEGTEYVLSTGASEERTVTIQHAGDPWTLPLAFFIRRDEALEAVKEFYQSGRRSKRSNWIEF